MMIAVNEPATLATAMHEAAHAVVALTLGVVPVLVVARGETGSMIVADEIEPWVWAIICGAGPAYEFASRGVSVRDAFRRSHYAAVHCSVDYAEIIKSVGRAGLASAVRAADGILRGTVVATHHVRIARALCDRDPAELTGADLLALTARNKVARSRVGRS